MNNNNSLVMIYQTLLAVPSMNENVKLTLSINRRSLLLLAQLVDAGLKQPSDDLKCLISVLRRQKNRT